MSSTLRHYASRLWRNWDRIAFRKYVAKHIYSEVPLACLIENHISRDWYDRDWPKLKEVTILASSKLKPNSLVFDIGAHECVVAMILSKIAGRIIAVEANPTCVDVALRNLQLNHVTNVTVVHGAADSKPGTLTFAGYDHVSRNERGYEKYAVPAVTIDALSLEYGLPDVLFIDVEGYEVEVLRGARKTLESKPDLFVEMHVGCGLESFGGSVEQVLKFLPDHRLFVAEPQNGNFLPLVEAAGLLEKRFFLVALKASCEPPCMKSSEKRLLPQ